MTTVDNEYSYTNIKFTHTNTKNDAMSISVLFATSRLYTFMHYFLVLLVPVYYEFAMCLGSPFNIKCLTKQR